ncbi:MAG: hypothetical protein IJM15_06460 [Erysipelotrichaceae bacterium]|nr:hypothetical protein [Erysipelotrichaceae bacterium]
MRELLIKSMKPVLCIMTVLDAFFIVRMFKEYSKNKKNIMPLLAGIICIGLFYDSLVLSMGGFVGFGSLLQHLSQFRYVLHYVLIPLLFPLCAYALTKKKSVITVVWALTAIIMVIGAAAGFLVVTEPVAFGVRRYAQAPETPAWVNTLMNLLNTVPDFLIIGIGVYLMIKKENPNLFLAGFLMLVFTLIGIFFGKDPSGDGSKSLMFYISMFGESLMVFFLYRYIKNIDK